MTKSRLVIIGSGPAGYTAALYAARAQLEPIVYTGIESGGQLMYTSELENFPGFPEGVIGPKFMWGMRQQAEKFGAVIKDQLITAVDFSARPFKLWTQLPAGINPDEYKRATPERWTAITQEIRQQEPDLLAESIIVATGAASIMLGLPGETELLGKGVSVCAVCDAAFFRKKRVFVVGGGDSAMEDSLALAKFTDQVTILHRRDSFKASKIMQDRVLKHPNITVLWNTGVTKVTGTDHLEEIELTTTDPAQPAAEPVLQTLPADGLFLAIGHRPTSGLFHGHLELDGHGYIVTRQSYSQQGLARAQAALGTQGLIESPTMTSVEGVFAAGDVVDVRYKQAVTAAGMGCQAALDVERWLERQG